MYTVDGMMYCVYCYEGFDLGQHAEMHMIACRLKKRTYVPMNAKKKAELVTAVEQAFRENLPGVLVE